MKPWSWIAILAVIFCAQTARPADEGEEGVVRRVDQDPVPYSLFEKKSADLRAGQTLVGILRVPSFFRQCSEKEVYGMFLAEFRQYAVRLYLKDVEAHAGKLKSDDGFDIGATITVKNYQGATTVIEYERLSLHGRSFHLEGIEQAVTQDFALRLAATSDDFKKWVEKNTPAVEEEYAQRFKSEDLTGGGMIRLEKAATYSLCSRQWHTYVFYWDEKNGEMHYYCYDSSMVGYNHECFIIQNSIPECCRLAQPWVVNRKTTLLAADYVFDSDGRLKQIKLFGSQKSADVELAQRLR